jgi:protein phosphatase
VYGETAGIGGDRNTVKALPSITFGVASDIGRVRSENQDSHGVYPSPDNDTGHDRLFVVADGMGGHRGGKEASILAVQTIVDSYKSDSTRELPVMLSDAITLANRRIHAASLADESLRGMGTTCVALVVRSTRACIAHVGDSRAYRVSKRGINQVTGDHTAVAEMTRRGILTPEEAKRHPERSVLYRALGTHPEAEVEVQPEIELTSNEWFVLCSDGLTNMVTDEEIRSAVVAEAPQRACDELVRLANERGGLDNITVIVVHVKVQDSFMDRLLSP